MNKSWDYGLRFAKIAHRMMKYAEVEVSLYWTWQNNYSIMSADLQEKYPSYYMTRHQVDFLNTGTQLVNSISSEPEVLSIGAIRPDGSKVLQLINLKKESVTVEVSGFDSQQIDAVITTQANNWETVKGVYKSKDRKTELPLKPASVSTFVFHQ